MLLSWLENCPIYQNVAGSIPSQGINPGCRFSPKLGHMQETMDVSHIDVFLLSLSPSLSLPFFVINKIILLKNVTQVV